MDTKDPQIVQQNKILLGGQTINLRARQLIYVLAALMDKVNPNAEITIDAKDFLNFVNANSGEKWTDIYKLTSDIFDHLNKNPILIKEPKKKDFVKVNWLSSLGVVQGTLKARFSADIADFLLYKQGLPYTKLLWDLRPYKSNFTARIMDLFQRFHNKNSGEDEITFDYDVEELKLFFGVHNKYKRFYDFEKRVLDVTQQELEKNDLAPYWFTYEKRKKGRNVKDIVFTVYLRPKVLLEMIPELKMLDDSGGSQPNLFASGQEHQFTEQQQKVYRRLLNVGLKKSFSTKILYNLTDTQATGYLYLLEYGVNRTLAFTIVKDYCSFGELVGYEHYYIKNALEKTEAARLKRIEENKTGKSKKRTTPIEKRGGLAKKVFVDKIYFPEFMERLSNYRAKEANEAEGISQKPIQPKKRTSDGTKSISDILNKMSK
jgi:plasmid replication initiation protein